MDSEAASDDSNESRTLIQRIGWFGRQELVLMEDKLQFRLRTVGRRDEFSIPFLGIDPEISRLKRRPFTLYITTAFLIAGVVGGVYLEANARRQNAGMGGTLAVICAIFFLICLVQSFKRTIDVFFFRTSRGNIVLRTNRPSLAKVQAFVRMLHEETESARSIERRLTRSLLQSLHAEGFLDKWQYEQVLERYCRNDAAGE